MITEGDAMEIVDQARIAYEVIKSLGDNDIVTTTARDDEARWMLRGADVMLSAVARVMGERNHGGDRINPAVFVRLVHGEIKRGDLY